MEKEFIKSKENKVLEGLVLLKPLIHKDNRGFFLESWNRINFNNLIKEELDFVQDNHSFSKQNVLRGLHYQIDPFSQGKLVCCSNGEIFDVAVDIRKNSPTFAQWAGVILNSVNHYKLWIPAGFAHGFLVLSDCADVHYKSTAYWSKEHEYSIKWDDPTISINWPKKSDAFKISDKDKSGTFLDEISPNYLF